MDIYPDLDETDKLLILTGCRCNIFPVMSRCGRSPGVAKTF